MDGRKTCQEPVGSGQAESELRSQTANLSKPWKRRVYWPNAIIYLVAHVMAIYGAFVALRRAHLTFIYSFILGVCTNLSVTMGAHRLYAHKSFKAKPMLRLALVLLHTISGQNSVWVWVRDHRLHHKFSDTNADPHNASAGFFFSHIGWLMCYKHPDVITKGKHIDMSDLNADPFVMFQRKYYKSMYLLLSFAIPVVVPVWLWDEDPVDSILVAYILRSVACVNCTWMVNSYAHMFGTRPYTQSIMPVEAGLVSFLMVGEGWHYYHHTFPWDYRASELGKGPNLTTTLLDLFARWGWAYDLRAPTVDTVRKHMLKRGDGSHPLVSTANHDQSSGLEL